MIKQTYRETATAFDRVAGEYDAAYGAEGNAVMTWMRRENLALLKDVFPRGSHLLELGCGTGEEAIALAKEGREVLATDISPGMCAVTQAKAVAARVGDKVNTVVLPAGHIGALNPVVLFDGAYASFGSLNCEPNLPAVSRGLSRLLNPGALFVTSVMGPVCLFEMTWFILHGRPRTAFRRLRNGWQIAPVSGNSDEKVTVYTRYLSTKDVMHAFTSSFELVRTFALPLFLPPPYADELYQHRGSFFRFLEQWDRRLRDRWPWRFLGDHIVIVLRRRQM